MPHCKMRDMVIRQAKAMDPENWMQLIERAAMVMLGIKSCDSKHGGETPESGSGPALQNAPRDGSTPWQVKCTQLAYLLYLLEYDDPNITAQQALDNYCENFDACYIA